MGKILNVAGFPAESEPDTPEPFVWALCCSSCANPFHPLPAFELTKLEALALMDMRRGVSIPASWKCGCPFGIPQGGPVLTILQLHVPLCRKHLASDGANLNGAKPLRAGELCAIHGCGVSSVPLCAECIGKAGGATGAIDFDHHPAPAGVACGAADHDAEGGTSC